MKKNYIITSNSNYVKSYDFNENKIYHIYDDGDTSTHYGMTIQKTDKKIKIIESSEKGNIRIWDFHSGKLLNIFNVDKVFLFGICLWNSEYIFVGSGDHKIKLIKLYNGEIIENVIGHKNSVLMLRKVIHPLHGECLISQGNDNTIKLWKVKINI